MLNCAESILTFNRLIGERPTARICKSNAKNCKQLTIGCDNNRQRHTTRSRNAADSLHIGPAEDGDPLALLICKGQAVQTDYSTLRNVVQFTPRYMLEDLIPHVPTHVHISTYTLHYTKDYYVTGL